MTDIPEGQAPKNKNNNIDEIEFNTSGEPLPLIPEGEYEAQVVKFEKGHFYGSKLYIHFRISDFSDFNGTILIRSYNFYNPIKRASQLWKDYQRIIGRKINKKERLVLKNFKNKIIRIKVRTVTHDSKQLTYKGYEQYSVVDSILEVLTGNQNANY